MTIRIINAVFVALMLAWLTLAGCHPSPEVDAPRGHPKHWRTPELAPIRPEYANHRKSVREDAPGSTRIGLDVF